MLEVTFQAFSTPFVWINFFQKNCLGIFSQKTMFLFVSCKLSDTLKMWFVVFANSQDLIELFSLLKHDADQTEEQ